MEYTARSSSQLWNGETKNEIVSSNVGSNVELQCSAEFSIAQVYVWKGGVEGKGFFLEIPPILGSLLSQGRKKLYLRW